VGYDANLNVDQTVGSLTGLYGTRRQQYCQRENAHMNQSATAPILASLRARLLHKIWRGTQHCPARTPIPESARIDGGILSVGSLANINDERHRRWKRGGTAADLYSGVERFNILGQQAQRVLIVYSRSAIQLG
jgi:hypothetical protein